MPAAIPLVVQDIPDLPIDIRAARALARAKMAGDDYPGSPTIAGLVIATTVARDQVRWAVRNPDLDVARAWLDVALASAASACKLANLTTNSTEGA